MVHAFALFSSGLFARDTLGREPRPPVVSAAVWRGAAVLALVGAVLLMAGCRTEGAASQPAQAQPVEVELPPMPGAQPMEALPEVDIEALEKAVAQERARQARELAAGQREPEQSRPLFEPLPDEADASVGSEKTEDSSKGSLTAD